MPDLAPDAVLVHLSGPRRGVSERLVGEEIPIWQAPDVGLPHAVFRRRGPTYELLATEGRDVWINGEREGGLVLASGDVLELGRGGPVVRFRLYPPGHGSFKSVAEVFHDCLDCARYERGGVLKRAAVLATGIPMELATKTSRGFRYSVVFLLLVLAASVSVLASRTQRVEQGLARQQQQVVGISDLLARESNPTSEDDARRMVEDLALTLSATTQRIESLEARAGAPARVIAAAARSTVFLQGSYGFVHAQSGLPMRLVLGPSGRPVRGPDGGPMVSTDGGGPEVEILYTGTGFVAARGGLVLTNRHVAVPWEADESAAGVIAQGWRPVMRRFVGYLVGNPEPFNVKLEAVSDSADLALLRCDGAARSVAPLRIRRDPPRAGEEVLVLGYPLGIQALLARADAAVVGEIKGAPGLSFWTVAERLAASSQIAPLASLGIVSQVTSSHVVYDAETTHGGSGGPVLDLNGEVVAVNTAIMPKFGGSNLGVPARRLVELLRKVK